MSIRFSALFAAAVIWAASAWSQAALSHSQSDALRRQSMNVADIERTLNQQFMIASNNLIEQQAMLIGQLQAAVATNPAVKQMLESLPVNEQAQLLQQYGLMVPFVSSWDAQKIDAAFNVIAGSNLPLDHPDVVAYVARVENLKDMRRVIDAVGTEILSQVLGASPLDDFPDYERDKQIAVEVIYQILDAANMIDEIIQEASREPATIEEQWVINQHINTSSMQKFRAGIEVMPKYEQALVDWQVAYAPLIASSATIAAEWSEIQGAYDNLAMKIYDAGPMAMDVLVQSIEHNFAYLDQALTNTGMARYAHENPTQQTGFSQAIENIEFVVDHLPRGFSSYNDVPGTSLDRIKEFEAKLEATALQAASDAKEQRRMLTADVYDGRDAEDIRRMALDLARQKYGPDAIHSVAIASVWDTTDYTVEDLSVPGEIRYQRYHYREIRVAVAIKLDAVEAIIMDIEVVEDFVRGQQFARLLFELPMWVANL